jgi:hypothetical protein
MGDIDQVLANLKEWANWLDADIGRNEPAGTQLREAATLITSLREALEEAKALNNKYALWAYGLAAGLTAILAVMASVAAALVMPSLWPMAAMSGGASIFMLFATWRIWHGIKTENVFEP